MKKKYILVLLMMLSVFIFTGCNKKVKLVEGEDYSIVNSGYYDKSATEKGYYVSVEDSENPSVTYTISSGEHNTGGYSLKIKEVYRIGDKTEIIVEEIEPKGISTDSMAFTYPTISIQLFEMPKKIVIKNTDGEEFIER